MKVLKHVIVSGLILVLGIQAKSQGNENEFLKAVYQKLEKVTDYSVEANIKVDMPFIRMIPTNVKIYFKQKGKFKVVSKSIAIVPRQGFDQLSKILANSRSFTAMTQGEEKIGDIQTEMVNLIPLSDTSDIVLGKFWIDPKAQVIIKSQLTTKSNGTIGTDYTYGSQLAYGLPDRMVFSVDVKKFKMPKGIVSNGNAGVTEAERNKPEKTKGRVMIILTNYQVNKGVPDSVFVK